MTGVWPGMTDRVAGPDVGRGRRRSDRRCEDRREFAGRVEATPVVFRGCFG